MRRIIFALIVCTLWFTIVPVHAGNIVDIPDEWVEAGARVIKGEAQGVKDEDQRAATLVVALNRIIDDRWPDDLCDVIYEPSQFAPYSGYVEQEYYDLAKDTITRWYEADDYYILPKDYFFFAGNGDVNYFRKEYRSKDHWRFE